MALPVPREDCAALITGASAGLGEQFAHQLAALGHDVVLVARRRERLVGLAEQIERTYGVRAVAIPCDVGDPYSRTALMDELNRMGTTVHILVNNAGFATGGYFVDSDLRREVDQARVLVEAVVDFTATYAPGMVARGSGAILNVASTAGMRALPYSAGYSAAKAHTLALTEALHLELKGAGVSVTALCPGPVHTEFWEVAGNQPIEGAMPRIAWVSAEKVVAAGLRGLDKNRRIVVPGWFVRLLSFGNRVAPPALVNPIMTMIMRPHAGPLAREDAQTIDSVTF